MKRCASCGHPEVDHEGLSCRAPEGRAFGGCGCRGFEDPDEPEDVFSPSVYDFPFDTVEQRVRQLSL